MVEVEVPVRLLEPTPVLLDVGSTAGPGIIVRYALLIIINSSDLPLADVAEAVLGVTPSEEVIPLEVLPVVAVLFGPRPLPMV